MPANRHTSRRSSRRAPGRGRGCRASRSPLRPARSGRRGPGAPRRLRRADRPSSAPVCRSWWMVRSVGRLPRAQGGAVHQVAHSHVVGAVAGDKQPIAARPTGSGRARRLAGGATLTMRRYSGEATYRGMRRNSRGSRWRTEPAATPGYPGAMREAATGVCAEDQPSRSEVVRHAERGRDRPGECTRGACGRTRALG